MRIRISPGRRSGASCNILVHQYFGVAADVVRDVVETHLQPLAEALRSHITTD
ncbi:DUF86 domain-containing protein [Janibacter limosus]|uniref:DUF86 domain-containing protein n=1 Tax=Janibacter limosus TaxID=53458 RepID=A0AC61U5Y4_9MICO|nr:HepT-like ribonuclease domain-containing protein [Janibacter limosus]UUZ45455.1 DUF86 domain-containing protein [Janibacter limosus]